LFEKKVLEELGYGLQLQCDFSTGEAILADCQYEYYPEQGFKQIAQGGYRGKSLLALASEQLEDKESLQEIKHLMRLALASLLGSQTLNSRKLFMLKDSTSGESE
jgi:DNA repair protein RecO (recombination protein O)